MGCFHLLSDMFWSLDTSSLRHGLLLKKIKTNYSRQNGQGLPKAHVCHLCAFSTIYLTNFKRHMRRHTGQLFGCKFCGMKYNCRYYLHKHTLKNHGVDMHQMTSMLKQ